MRAFMMRMGAAGMFLVSVLLLESMVAGSLSFLGGIMLLPASAMAAFYLFAAGNRAARRAARAARRARQRAAMPARATTLPQPALRVAAAQPNPRGPRAA